MIVSVCSDKGAPGVSTLAVALGMVWPGDRVVVEADTAGSDLSFRLHPAVPGTPGAHLAPDPSIAGLATAARLGLSSAGPLPFAQDTSLGVPVVPGVLSAERFRALRSLWPGLGQALAAWPGTVLADLGRLSPGSPAAAVATASTAVLLLTRADLEGLFHLRDKVVELAGMVGPARRREGAGRGGGDRPGEAAAGRGGAGGAGAGLDRVTGPGAGLLHRTTRRRRSNCGRGVVTRRLAGSDLVRSARSVAESVLATWPALAAAATHTGTSTEPAAAAGERDQAVVGS